MSLKQVCGGGQEGEEEEEEAEMRLKILISQEMRPLTSCALHGDFICH